MLDDVKNFLKILKKLYNLFMDDQYYWIVCLPCFVLRGVWCEEVCRLSSVQVRECVLSVLVERGGLCH
jgi:hypothetical protein